MWKSVFFLSAGVLMAAGLFAQPVGDDLPQVTGCIALTNARVISMAGKAPVVENVILRDGLITALGPQAAIPADAYRIAADSFYVYPAFIDAFSYIGIKEPEQQGGRGNQRGGQNRDRPEIDDEGFASLAESGITPFNDVRSVFDPKDKSIADWRAQGFAVAHIVPRGKMIPGQGSLAVLSGKDADQMLWKENVSFFGQWVGAGNVYPSTVIAVMAKWRELYHNAEQEITHLAAYQVNTMVSRPPYNQAHKALIPLVKKEETLYFRAPGVKDISRALAMQKDLGMKMVIGDAREAWYLKDQFRSNGIPLILSLDLPDEKKADKEEGAPGNREHRAEKQESTDSLEVKTPPAMKKDSLHVDKEKEAFEKRRLESVQEHQAQAGVLAKEGIPFSFGTLSGKPAEFRGTMRAMLQHGLDENMALFSLTMQPARLLGIDRYCGSIEPGKMANLIIADKPVFEKEAAIRYMIVEGNLYAYEGKDKKRNPERGNRSTESKLEGTWSYTVDIPDNRQEGTLEFISAHGEWQGTIVSPQITSGNSTLKGIVVEGNKVSFTYDFDMDGQTVEIEFDLTLNEDALEGSISVGGNESYSITCNRVSKPN
jgi:hypothetical protein